MRALVAWVALLAVGCDLPTDTGTSPTGPDPLRLESSALKESTNASGKLKIQLDVPDDAVSFQITGDSNEFVSFDSLKDPDGRTVLAFGDWAYGTEQLTLAFFPQRNTTALNWPIRGIDGPLAPGLWTVQLATTNAGYYYQGNTKVDVSTETKFDPDLSTGHIGVQVVWAAGVDQEKGVADAVDAATARWADIWSKQGIEVSYYYVNSKLDPDLSFANVGDPAVSTVAAKKDPGDLQLIVGDTIRHQGDLFGLSAGIPGTVDPSPSTYVVLSWQTHAGPDGKFDADEIRLMGETMAHECAHYTGLFHPVESTYASYDAIDDTPECKSGGACDSQLGDNVMYPYPICSVSTCAPQGKLTDQQGEIMNQFVGAL